ncbi:hypothetical protein ABI_27470 [Asticcacaulis biprosthecium C19]|uniref:Uncharacterized protein n=1 Tax=Asticcacaulis biprosthecium C19 TaxID=715226 RepID=F4QM91_9CAUL|nr:hypothetical protein [Asticcacaulis biprosthecium]EGF91332.1 hypothetical protein ABI_27470 [Asticcacaulis biprosthecium C19]
MAAVFDLKTCLNWTRLDARDAMRDLKLILQAQDFRSLFTGVVEAGFYRGWDGDGNTVTVHVVTG